MQAEKLKMYILVRDSIPLGLAMTAVAHASAAACLRWHDPGGLCEKCFSDWLSNSFKKVVCKVTDKEFEKAKGAVPEDDRIVMVESALDGAETAMVFMPREEMPKMFKYLKLYK